MAKITLFESIGNDIISQRQANLRVRLIKIPYYVRYCNDAVAETKSSVHDPFNLSSMIVWHRMRI